jgi:hypothetical protein
MKKVLLLFLFIICLPWKSFTQKDSSLVGTLQGYVIPFPWIDKNPRLRLGMEYHAHDHKSYSLEIGFGNNSLNQSRLDRGVWGQAYSFFEVRPEIKWFPHIKWIKKETFWTPWYLRNSNPLPRYFAVEVFYQEMHDVLENNNYNPKAGETEVAYDQASFKKIKIGGHAKVGIKILIWKRVVLDIYEGVGLAYRKITYFNLVNPRAFEATDEWWGDSYKNEGAYFLLQLSLGVRVGYVLGKIN